ncbi:hypothetical protein [Pelomonas cellulosilytica]|uniref:hypothetical protein n=1 Tax=Pelomonas cellulosilytica TaxID=2906762 RepID=UPI003B01BE34
MDLQTPEGVRFKLGTGFTDTQRRDPPPIGATVTYRYRDLTPTRKPRFSSFLRVAEAFWSVGDSATRCVRWSVPQEL